MNEQSITLVVTIKGPNELVDNPKGKVLGLDYAFAWLKDAIKTKLEFQDKGSLVTGAEVNFRPPLPASRSMRGN